MDRIQPRQTPLANTGLAWGHPMSCGISIVPKRVKNANREKEWAEKGVRTTISPSPELLKIPCMTAGCSHLFLKDSFPQVQPKVFLVYPGYQITAPVSWKMMNSFKQQVRTLGITQLQPVITAAKYKILHVPCEPWFAFSSTCIFKNLIPSLAVRRWQLHEGRGGRVL